MQAAVVEKFGVISRAIKVHEKPVPVARDGHVVVKVAYAAAHLMDTIAMSGMLAMNSEQPDLWGKISPPYTPGYDFSGTVHSVGPNVTELKEGEDVWGTTWGVREDSPAAQGGTFAQYVELEANKVSLKPESMELDTAGGLGLTGLAALQGIEHALTSKEPGQTKLLILGGDNTVGQLALQLAREKAVAFVGTTVSSAKGRERVEALGVADLIVDGTSKSEPWESLDALQDLDAIFDTIGQQKTWQKVTTAKGLMKDDANYACVGLDQAAGMDPAAHAPRPFAANFIVKHDTAQLNELASLVASGKVKLTIEQVFDFNLLDLGSFQAALKKEGSGKAIGKCLVKF